MAAAPFTIEIDEEVLADLRDRLARTRFPGAVANTDWDYGTNESYLREIVDYFVEQFDWRADERAMHEPAAPDSNPADPFGVIARRCRGMASPPP